MKRFLFLVASLLIAGVTNVASASERLTAKITGDDEGIEQQKQQPLVLEKLADFKASLTWHASHSSHSSHSSHYSHRSHSSHYSSR